jgi:SAM-dependent methyltransferase
VGKNSLYGGFAGLYDAFMDDVDYQAGARYYLDLIEANGTNAPIAICDCGCGTGSMAIAWAGAGHTVIGVDISDEMLEAASAKARAYGVCVPFINQDMRALALHRPVDAIIAACDSVNYLTAPSGARAFFKRAHTCLKKGGVLAFDISSRDKLESMDGRFFVDEREDMAYIWHNRLNAKRTLIEMDLTFFVAQDDGLYRRFAECHTLRLYDIDDLTQWLLKSGFSGEIKIYGDRTFDFPSPQEPRIHIVAKKSD